MAACRRRTATQAEPVACRVSSPTVELTQALIQAASPSGAERPAADVLIAAFEAYGFDEAYLDDAGNAIGILNGRSDGPTVMMNGHIDTVPTGDPDLWPHPPLSGALADGRVWGRGASDMKGSLAAMTVATAGLKGRHAGQLIVSGVVQEEVGGLGARHLAATLPYDVVILGEPSKLRFKTGHRGRVEVHVRFPGAIAHAARPELGRNALTKAARFVTALDALTLPERDGFGVSTATPTQLVTYPQGGANVVPGEATLTVDYRNVPGDSMDDVLARLAALDPDAEVTVLNEEGVSESGLVRMDYPRMAPAYETPPGEMLDRSRHVVKQTLHDLDVPWHEDVWWFMTDAPHLASNGAPVLGFGPGEEEVAHTTRESVKVDALESAARVYGAWAQDLLGG